MKIDLFFLLAREKLFTDSSAVTDVFCFLNNAQLLKEVHKL